MFVVNRKIDVPSCTYDVISNPLWKAYTLSLNPDPKDTTETQKYLAQISKF